MLTQIILLTTKAVYCLFIFAKKGFGEWTDFWYDMGERIFSNDAYDPEDDRADADDETPTCDDDE